MTNAEKQEKIEVFIDENNLTFEEGQRNTDSTVLSGYALHIGLRTLPTLVAAVENQCDDADYGWEDELERVFDYAKDNAYGDWWNSKEARDRYIF